MNKLIDAHAMYAIELLGKCLDNQASDIADVLAVALGMIGASGRANEDQFGKVLALAVKTYHQCQYIMKEGIK